MTKSTPFPHHQQHHHPEHSDSNGRGDTSDGDNRHVAENGEHWMSSGHDPLSARFAQAVVLTTTPPQAPVQPKTAVDPYAALVARAGNDHQIAAISSLRESGYGASQIVSILGLGN